MARADSVLRGVEAGTRAGWVVLAGAAVFLVYKFLGPKSVVRTPLLPPAPPAGAGSPPEPAQATDPSGIAAGSLVTSLRAAIIEPVDGGKVERRAFSSFFRATMEVVNQSHVAQSAQVEIVCDFYEFGGVERLGIRTRLPVIELRPIGVERLEVEIDSGNFRSLAFEFAQANATVQVWTNGKLTQGLVFEVW